MPPLSSEFPIGAKRVAFFGGSFDPPHLGHLAVAREACAVLGLDLVLFAPVGAQPLKPQGSTAGFADRVAMTRLAIAEDPQFAVSEIDAPKDSGAPNYTLDTLLTLRSMLPADGELFCLMGADSFAGLRKWWKAAEVPFAASLVVASRPPSTDSERLGSLAENLPEGLAIEEAADSAQSGMTARIRRYRIRNSAGQSAAFYLLPGLHVDISATQIRRLVRAAEGGHLAGSEVLPSAVAQYIVNCGLYK
jgi:nicotinate-nucleotide adenylyltransferase